MEFPLFRRITQFSGNRACVARQATPGMAFGSRGLQQVLGTTIYIVAIIINSADRATLQAGPGVTTETGGYGRDWFPHGGKISAQ